MEHSQQQIDAFKEATHVGNITGTMYRIKDDSSLADFLWQNQGYWQRSNVTKEMILTNTNLFSEYSWKEE